MIMEVHFLSFTPKLKNLCLILRSLRKKLQKLFANFPPSKAHGCDDISVSMLQLRPDKFAYPLRLIFQKCIETGSFPDSWKKANVQHIRKKNNRQLIWNYRPIPFFLYVAKSLKK